MRRLRSFSPSAALIHRRLILTAAVAILSVLPRGIVLAEDGKPTPAETPSTKAVPTPPAPHSSTNAVKKELTEVIDGQLAAFRTSDFVKAYSYAATPIKALFAQNDFAVMVRTAYPAIASSKRVEYGLSFDTGDEAVINVHVEDAQGRGFQYQYLLQKEAGQWKISGVTESKSGGLSV